MLDENTALALLKKYGYDSQSLHPFLYKKDNTIGICYSFVDDNFGILERVFFFNSSEEMDQFLKEFQWCKNNGKSNNVRMILENYETVNPKVIYLRNEKIMVKDEMFNIEQFDQMEKEKQQMDKVSRILLESANLLAYYDTNKQAQLDYFKNVLNLNNVMRQKYFDLQKEVDTFNGVQINRQLRLLPTALGDCGISLPMEIAAKDRLSQYKAVHPEEAEAIDFIHDVWELNMNLELNDFYFKNQKDENSILNETKVVNEKMNLIKEINTKKSYFFGLNLIKKFREINRKCKAESAVLSDDYINNTIANIKKKYSMYDKLDYLSACDYLKEAIQNNNYDALAIKYGTKAAVDDRIIRLPMKEVIADLTQQYLKKVDVADQALLTLYNSKLKNIIEYILQIPNYSSLAVQDILKVLQSKEDFEKLKKECFTLLRSQLDEAVNLNIKAKVFKNINFETFENFIQSLIGQLPRMLNLNEKMVLNSDITLYFKLAKLEDLQQMFVYPLTDNLNSLVADLKNETEMIGLVLLKRGTPVIFSPYMLDFGNQEEKDSSKRAISVKNITNVNMLLDVNDVLILRDENLVNVVKYFSEAKKENGISIVEELKNGGKTVFCKFTISNNLGNALNNGSIQAPSSLEQTNVTENNQQDVANNNLNS